ncbi:MAG: FAD-binding oxidoreductase [Actinobacteria bacterium]|nr:FAD-binding oxidoreductase [Actinomycetota bacterium]
MSGVTQPTPPIDFGDGPLNARWSTPRPSEMNAIIDELRAICPISTTGVDLAEHARDWWPLAMRWALQAQVPQLPSVVATPSTTDEVRRIVLACARHDTPLTVTAGRSGVSGASVPLFGGVVLDTTHLRGVVSVDRTSGIVEVLPGTFGPDLERAVNEHGLTVGHFPQSFDISTVGGWVACHGAGQFSTRYGKIHDMVVGLEVVLADGSVIRTGGAPAAAHGPDVSAMFIGSEGTLGVVTRVWLRAHEVAPVRRKAAYFFASFADGVAAMRETIRAHATPAVLRLYDAIEAQRSHGGDGSNSTLIVLDDGEPEIVAATLAVVDRCALAHGAVRAHDERVDHWLAHRNDTSGLQALTKKGFVIDTMEVAAPWSKLTGVYTNVVAATSAVSGARSVSAHVSHSYLDGACIYFTFVGQLSSRDITDATTAEHERLYLAMWNAAQRAALTAGANLAHHHGVGLNRGRFMREAMGDAFNVVMALKQALDPRDIFNPGKLGLPTRRGAMPWSGSST